MIYITVPPGDVEFYPLLGHECGHLFDPAVIDDGDMKGFCMVFSEEICSRTPAIAGMSGNGALNELLSILMRAPISALALARNKAQRLMGKTFWRIFHSEITATATD